MPFLSLLDDRAKPKGSRDPLGFELVWTHYGRQVIGNLTTITSNLTNFAVALLGFKWANDIHAHLPEDERHIPVRNTFLKYEQLTGYLRYLAGNEGIMGITRVRRRMEDPQARITFGLGAGQQILSDQASYGLWGLYSAAMRDTGLIKGDDRVPIAMGAKIAQEIENRLDKDYYFHLFTRSDKFRREDLEPIVDSFLSAINEKGIRDQLLDALMNGNRHQSLQQEMWRMTQALAESGATVQSIPDFIQQVKSKTREDELKKRLNDIEQVERVLVAANNIFHYCRRKDGERFDKVLSRLSGRYDYAYLPDTIDFHNVPRHRLLNDILRLLKSNKTGDAVIAILELNRIVMEQRGGSPWVEMESGNTLRVRVQSETDHLKDQEYLANGWDYDYFLGSFIRLAGDGLGAKWTTQ